MVFELSFPIYLNPYIHVAKDSTSGDPDRDPVCIIHKY